MGKGWEVHQWTTEEQERLLVEIAAIKARHRQQGCKVFDEMLARCTCIRGSEND